MFLRLRCDILFSVHHSSFSHRVSTLLIIATLALFFGPLSHTVPVARAADPVLPVCEPLSGNTSPVLYSSNPSVTNTGALYFGSYILNKSVTSNSLGQSVFYVPSDYVACGILLESAGKQSVQIRGWVWDDNVGWVSLYCSNGSNRGVPCGDFDYSVQMDPKTGVFSGYAWSNLGWIRMNCAPDALYGDKDYCISPFAVTLNITNSTVDIPQVNPSNPPVLTNANKNAWSWTAAAQWISFGGLKVPLDTIKKQKACDPKTDIMKCDTSCLIVGEAKDPLTGKCSCPAGKVCGCPEGQTYNIVTKQCEQVPLCDLVKDPACKKPLGPKPCSAGDTYNPGTQHCDVDPKSCDPLLSKVHDPAKKECVSAEKCDVATGKCTACLPGQTCTCDPLTAKCDSCPPGAVCGKDCPPSGCPNLNFGDVNVGVPFRAGKTAAGGGSTPYSSEGFAPVSQAQARNLIYKNVVKWKTTPVPSCDAAKVNKWLLDPDSVPTYYCHGDLTSLQGPPGNSFTISKNKTLIVQGGNVYLSGSLFPDLTDPQLGLIVLRDKLTDTTQGNLYLEPNVRDVRVNMYLDGSLYPFTPGNTIGSDGVPLINPDTDYQPSDSDSGSFFGQLSLQGMIIANNHAKNPDPSASYFENMKNLAYLRSFPAGPPDPDTKEKPTIPWDSYLGSSCTSSVDPPKSPTQLVQKKDAEDNNEKDASGNDVYTSTIENSDGKESKYIKQKDTAGKDVYTPAVSAPDGKNYPCPKVISKGGSQGTLSKLKFKATYYPKGSDASTGPYAISFTYEPPSSDLPGFEGIGGSGFKQSGGR